MNEAAYSLWVRFKGLSERRGEAIRWRECHGTAERISQPGSQEKQTGAFLHLLRVSSSDAPVTRRPRAARGSVCSAKQLDAEARTDKGGEAAPQIQPGPADPLQLHTETSL